MYDENTLCRVIYSSVALVLSLELHAYSYYNMNIFLKKTCHIKLSVPGGPARQKHRVKSCAGAPVRRRAVATATCRRAIFFARKWLIIHNIRRYNNIILFYLHTIYLRVRIPTARRATEFTRSRASPRPWRVCTIGDASHGRNSRVPARVLQR